MTLPNLRPRVLFVDDEADVRRAFERTLRSRGFQVTLAASGSEALRLAQAQPFPVVVTDLRMPGLDGIALIERIAAISPNTSFVVVTGMPEVDLRRDHGAAQNVTALVPKPWKDDELASIIERAAELQQQRAGAAESKGALQALLLDLGEQPELERSLREALPASISLVRTESVEDAVAHLHDQPTDLIFVQAEPGETQSLECIRLLHPASQEAAIIVMSPRSDEALALEAIRAGAQDFVTTSKLCPEALRSFIRLAVERKRAEQRLAHRANYDQLTGLANRSTLRRKLVQSLARATRNNEKLAVMFLDLDHFKAINDAYGHGVGDHLLREVSDRLLAAVREYDTVARLAGDEFAILVEGLENAEIPEALAQRIVSSLARPISAEDTELAVTSSIGIASYPGAGDTADELLKAADFAMYLAKQRGRNTFVRVQEPHGAQAKKALSLAAQLRVAKQADQFCLHYQPQVCLPTLEVVGLEALMRWRREDGVLVPPSEFIPVLEDCGLILEAGAWVLHEACRKLSELRAMGCMEMRMAVNLSAKQFEATGLVRVVADALQDFGLPPACLELEITESLLMRDTERTNRTLADLKALGVRIAIDDFGTGYSSLAYLDRFDVDVLKIDRSFIRAIARDGQREAVAGAVVGLGHQLGLEVIAEGVESELQLAYMVAQGCNMAQGYLFGHPCEEWLPAPRASVIMTRAPLLRAAV
jgi:diguanylate cyclase (GGDEF)-like protein